MMSSSFPWPNHDVIGVLLLYAVVNFWSLAVSYADCDWSFVPILVTKILVFVLEIISHSPGWQDNSFAIFRTPVGSLLFEVISSNILGIKTIHYIWDSLSISWDVLFEIILHPPCRMIKYHANGSEYYSQNKYHQYAVEILLETALRQSTVAIEHLPFMICPSEKTSIKWRIS